MRVIKFILLLLLILCIAGCSQQSLFNKNVGGMAFEVPPGYSDAINDFTLNPASIQLGYVDGENFISSQIIDIATEDDVVYKYGYYSLNDGPWQQFTLSGREIGSSWILGQAQESITVFADEIVSGENNYVITYSCTRLTGSWDCHDRQWQIRNFEAEVFEETAEQQCISDLGCWHDGVCYATEDYVEAINSICNFGEWVELPGEPPAIGEEPEPRQRVDESVTISAPLDTPLGSVKSVFTAQDFNNALKDRSISTSSGTSTYLQEISLRSTSLGENQPFGVVHAEDDSPTEEVDLWLHIPEGVNDVDTDAFFQWGAYFNPSLKADTTKSGLELEGEILNILGTDFEIIEAELVSNEVNLKLARDADGEVLALEQVKTVEFDGNSYEVYITAINSEQVVFLVTDELGSEEATDLLSPGDIDMLNSGLMIYAGEIGNNTAEFYIFSSLIEFTDILDDEFTNDVEISLETIEEGWIKIEGSVANNEIEINSIEYRLTADAIVGTTNVYVPEGQSLASYLDEPEELLGLNIAFVGLTQETTTPIEIYARGDDEYRIRATNMQGNTYDFPYVEIVDGNLRFGEDNTEKLVFDEDADFTSKIGELDQSDFTIYPDDKFVASRGSGDVFFSHVVEYESVNLTEQVISFTDLAIGTKEFTYQTSTADVLADPAILGEGQLVLGGNAYKVYVSNFSGNPLTIDLDGDGAIEGDTVVFGARGGGIINLDRNVPQPNDLVGPNGAIFTLFTAPGQFADLASGGEILEMNINQLNGVVSMSLESYTRNGVDRTTQLPIAGGLSIPTTGVYSQFAFNPQEPDALADHELEMTDYGVGYDLYDPTGGAPEELSLTYPENQVFGQVIFILSSYE